MKTKKIRIRQGFTIVELVIVIGVIGVLSAVLIPTFVNLNNKANQAADEALIKNLNTQLRMKETSEGKNKTLTAALADAAEAGYLVENLTPKSGKDIVWNQDKDEFSQLETAPTEDAYKFWKIYEKAEDIPSTQTYSVFAKGKAWTTVPTLTVGFDAGENTEIAALNFETTATREVTIRTNGTGTALTVNAKNATVNHYDVLDGLTVTAIAGESYHEWGTVNSKAVIKSGHIEVEQGASVPEVSVEGATGAVKVTANTETTISVDTASAAQTSVEANAQDVFVDGLDQSKISGSQASTVSLPTEIMSESELRSAANCFAKLGADIVINTDTPISVTGKGILDLNGHNITFGADIADETSLYQVGKNGYLSVTGTGKITANARMFEVAGELRVESGTFVTTVLANTAAKRSTILSEKGSRVIINGGDFYSAKANVFTLGELVINGGTFTSIANASFSKAEYTDCTDVYAYSILPADKTTVNGGRFYGVHGGFAQQGGNLVFNDAYVEVSNEAFARYSAVQTEVHYINHKTDTKTITGSTTVPNSSMYYCAYLAGESFSVTVEINGGEFVNKGAMYAVHVGNSAYGDGGERLPAFASITGGKFVSQNNEYALSIDKYVGTMQVSGGNYNKEYIKAGGTKMKLSDAANVLVSGYKVITETDGTWSVVKK